MTMTRSNPTARAGIAAAVLGAMVAGSAMAQDYDRQAVADFYDGKNLKLLIAFSPGGGYALYGRVFTRHFSEHVPGEPNVIIQHMSGAGGKKAANYFYNIAPKDGSMLAELSNQAALAQKMQPEGVKYDASEINYVGRFVSMRSALVVRSDAPATSLEDAKENTLILGATGRSGQGYMNAAALERILGYKIKIVAGYPGSGEMDLAMQRGETHGRVGSWGSWKARYADMLKKGEIKPIAIVGLDKAPDLPDVPTFMSLADNQRDKEILEFMASSTAVGRTVSAPPDIPADRLAALREAFMATMEDPDFLAEAKKNNMDLDPLAGAELQKIVNKTVATSGEIVQATREALGL